MNVKQIVVDELPTNCIDCQFHQILDYVGAHHCTGKPRTITHDKHGDLSRPSWCPLQVEEVCEWVLEKTDRGYAAFYIPKDHEQHQDCFTQNADTFKYCPSCGKRIKYVEVE